MVSLAETHLKLLLSADSEEKELQGFTLVQLLLVRISTLLKEWQQLQSSLCGLSFLNYIA